MDTSVTIAQSIHHIYVCVWPAKEFCQLTKLMKLWIQKGNSAVKSEVICKHFMSMTMPFQHKVMSSVMSPVQIPAQPFSYIAVLITHIMTQDSQTEESQRSIIRNFVITLSVVYLVHSPFLLISYPTTQVLCSW